MWGGQKLGTLVDARKICMHALSGDESNETQLKRNQFEINMFSHIPPKKDRIHEPTHCSSEDNTQNVLIFEV